jgi:hypothetical protein
MTCDHNRSPAGREGIVIDRSCPSGYPAAYERRMSIVRLSKARGSIRAG